MFRGLHGDVSRSRLFPGNRRDGRYLRCASISDIPWKGPISGVSVGLIDGEYVINPDAAQRKASPHGGDGRFYGFPDRHDRGRCGTK